MNQTWICDTCGKTIDRVDDGWVEWLVRQSDHKMVGDGLRLVHQSPPHLHSDQTGCQYQELAEKARDNSQVYDQPLSAFLGPDGLIELLSFIADGELPTEEVLEMIKRLHIPGYEQARLHFDKAIAGGVIEPNTPEGYYTQEDINAVLEYARKYPL